MAMLNVLAPRVVRPPWASRMAWNTSTMTPSTAVAGTPKRMAARPVPVIWLQLPVTEGIFRDEITKTNAPAMASSSMAFRCSFAMRRMERTPAARKGRQMTPQMTQKEGGR